MMTIAFIGYCLFLLVYTLMGSAVIYHLRAYSLPTWSLGRISIVGFVVLSAVLITFATYFFFRIPWESLDVIFYR